MYGQGRNEMLKLTCPRCHRLKEYAGYPPDPILSTVLCLNCRYAGPGGTFEHEHPTGERCAKDVRGCPWYWGRRD